MANTDDFWGRLGETLEGSSPVCGCALGGSQTAIDASLALNQVLNRYAVLSSQGAALQKIASGKVQVPCAIWTAYANARQDYLTKAQDVFDQLTAKGITVEQVLYAGGKPKLDPQDRSRAATARLLAPLRPPSFTGLGQQCPGWVDMNGAYHFAGLGWERTPIQLASVPVSAFTAISGSVDSALVLVAQNALLGVATPSAYQTLKKVAVLPREFETDTLRPVTAYTTCFLAQSDSKEAVKHCTPATAVRAQARRPIEMWRLLGIGALLLIAGGLFLRTLRRAQLAGVEPADVYSRPGDGIFLGDLYWRPRPRTPRRLAGI